MTFNEVVHRERIYVLQSVCLRGRRSCTRLSRRPFFQVRGQLAGRFRMWPAPSSALKGELTSVPQAELKGQYFLRAF
ncbi:hypothetical protein AMTR_s00008p00261590 [Amborella trichopoda]|uniref:Uncharacterized protein n=1 Tax=Amborella trichopoda TaxID=13333 RepID=W1NI43_AMBTC|nr:hypothetical protein AMTR_s00008p00261590 [Amborella trichopoda]